jgi:hypothetical protein
MQSATNRTARGIHHRADRVAKIPQNIANAPNAEKFSGNGANLKASVKSASIAQTTMT